MKALNQLREDLRNLDTDPLILKHLIRIIIQQTQGFEIKMFNTTTTSTENMDVIKVLIACNEQQKIGNWNLLKGILTIEFKYCQAEYWKQKGRVRNVDNWMRNVIKALHVFSVTIWKERSAYVTEVEKINQETRLRQHSKQI